MAHTNTTNLNLQKDDGNESIVGFRGVTNSNMDLIDIAYGQYLDDYEQSLENVAAIEGTTASAAHAVGTYLVQNGTLYLVTSAIDIGDTITPGTNIIATDLNTAVTNINNAVSGLGSSIASVEQTIATTNHSEGDYFMLGNVLMCATDAIVTGDQITALNATPATMQSQIDALRDSVVRVPDNANVESVEASGRVGEGLFCFEWERSNVKYRFAITSNGIILTNLNTGQTMFSK